MMRPSPPASDLGRRFDHDAGTGRDSSAMPIGPVRRPLLEFVLEITLNVRFGTIGEIDIVLDVEHVLREFVGFVEVFDFEGAVPCGSFLVLARTLGILCILDISLGADFLAGQDAGRRSNAKQASIEFELLSFLGFVDLDMLLHPTHHRGPQMVELDRFLSDLPQRDNRLLVIVPINRERAAGGDFTRPLRRE
jgi:hypothetical protein